MAVEGTPGLTTTSKITANSLGPEYLDLARELSLVHGKVMVARESSGIHFYMASPACLTQDGRVELFKRHLAVNADKYLREGKQRCAMCMKTSRAYTIDELLRMPPLDERGIKDVQRGMVQVQVNEARPEDLEPDAQGRMVPKGPGFCVPAFQLPKDHPARLYLAYRQFEAHRLYRQFRLSWCDQEREDRFYRPLPCGFAATPQGRIVFHVDMLGRSHGWQARLLELPTEDQLQLLWWHPYQQVWFPVKHRPTPEDKWEPFEHTAQLCKEMPKYLFGKGQARNQVLMGLDAALAWNRGRKVSTCVLAEGALDAGRAGPPGIATLGKFISEFQTDLLVRHFRRLIYVADNDQAGTYAKEKLSERMKPHPQVEVQFVTPTAHDLGDVPQGEADDLLREHLK